MAPVVLDQACIKVPSGIKVVAFEVVRAALERNPLRLFAEDAIRRWLARDYENRGLLDSKARIHEFALPRRTIEPEMFAVEDDTNRGGHWLSMLSDEAYEEFHRSALPEPDGFCTAELQRWIHAHAHATLHKDWDKSRLRYAAASAARNGLERFVASASAIATTRLVSRFTHRMTLLLAMSAGLEGCGLNVETAYTSEHGARNPFHGQLCGLEDEMSFYSMCVRFGVSTTELVYVDTDPHSLAASCRAGGRLAIGLKDSKFDDVHYEAAAEAARRAQSQFVLVRDLEGITLERG